MGTRLRRLTVAACSLAAVATLGVTPQASADVTRLDVIPLVPHAGFGANCTYLLVATTASSRYTPATKGVSFVDLNRNSRFFPADDLYAAGQLYFTTPVVGNRAFSLWTPTRPGKHVLMAYQTSAGGPQRSITVRSGTPVGPGCIVGR